MLPFSRRSRPRDEALSDDDLVEVIDELVSSSGVVAKAACAKAVASVTALAPAAESSVDVLLDDDPSIPGPPPVPSFGAIPTPLSSVAIPIDVASSTLLADERPLPAFRSSSASLPSFPLGSSPALDVTFEPDVFSDDEPTRPLGTLPPPPFPRHLQDGRDSSLEDPPTVRISEDMLPPEPISSLAPVAADASGDRRSPTIRVRPMVALDDDEIRLIRRRPSFAWAAALVVLGAGAGIGTWEGLQALRGDDVAQAISPLAPVAPPPPVAAAAPPAVAVADATKTEAPKSDAPRASDVKVDAPPKPAEKVATKSEGPKVAPRVVSSPASTPAAPAKKVAAVASAAPVPPPGPLKKESPRPVKDELASDAQADALARAQLKAALR